MSARDLCRELRDALGAWETEPVAVRIVTAASNDLIAVFSGMLGPASDEKPPSLFWPLRHSCGPAELERPGIYAHPELLDDVRVHVGNFVVEFDQAGTTVNVRRLPVHRDSEDEEVAGG